MNESAFVHGRKNRKVKIIAQLNNTNDQSFNQSGFVDVLEPNDEGSGRSHNSSELNTSKSQTLSLISSKL